MADINNEKKREIEEKVSFLLKENDLSEDSYVDIVSLVRKEGFSVRSADLPIETTGYLAVNDDSSVEKEYRKLIVVNTKYENKNNDDKVVLKKSRFITAHEYGHFILHKSPDEPLYAHRDSGERDTLQELEADYFARAILMPADAFVCIEQKLEEISQSIKLNKENFEDAKFSFLCKYFNATKDKVMKRMGDVDFLKSINANA